MIEVLGDNTFWNILNIVLNTWGGGVDMEGMLW